MLCSVLSWNLGVQADSMRQMLGVNNIWDMLTGHVHHRLWTVQSDHDKNAILVAACHNGFVYGLDASSGDRVWARKPEHGMSLVAMETYACVNAARSTQVRFPSCKSSSQR